MPTPAPAPLRVAECRGCGQLFAVYATEGAVACPSCSLPFEVATLEMATLGVAEPIEVRIEAPAPTEPAADSDPVVSSDPATENAPTVAEWLMRNEEDAAAEGDETLPAPEPAVKPTLSESLGWKESLPGIDPPVTESLSAELPEAGPAVESSLLAPVGEEPVAATEEPAAEPADDFRFDFGATPLSEASAETEVAPTESLDLTTPSDTELPQPGELSWDRVGASAEERRRGWLMPLATLTALVLVAAGAGFYLIGSIDSEPAALAEANRGARLNGEASDALTPPDPYPPAETNTPGVESGAVVPPPEPSSAAARVDHAARPATYEAPELDTLPQADSLANLPPALPAASPEPEASGERYASYDAKPLDELPPAASPVPPAEPSVPQVEDRRGLIGVPPTTLDQLEAALPDSEAAGRAFATGDLADAEQVSVLGQHYAQLSYLAQTLTLLDPEERGSRAMATEMEAVDIFTKLFRTSRGRSQTLQVAVPWVNWAGRPYGGVFFSGDPTSVAQAGSVMRYDFPIGDQSVPVILSEALDTQRLLVTGAKEIGVLGVVVEEPHKWIAGYEGPAERVVWARKTLALPEAVAR